MADSITSNVVDSFSADLDSTFGLRESAVTVTAANRGDVVNVDELEQTVEEKYARL